MKVLFHYAPFILEVAEKHQLPGRNDEVIALGDNLGKCTNSTNWLDFDSISTILPDGWRPDLYLHWTSEYFPVPMGIENVDCFTVLVSGDWNLGGKSLKYVGRAFDLVVTDVVAYNRIRGLGFDRVEHSLIWAYEPSIHHRIEGIDRDIDISFVGNFNHGVQIEREKWLARVAKLSSRYRVVVDSGIFAEDYVKLLNRSIIAFNYSIASGVNMRCYEAAACGALLFIEESNVEVAQVLNPGKECILYNDDNFEKLVDYYLNHEDERQQIAEAGFRKIQGHTFAHHLSQMVAIAERHMQTERKPRMFAGLPEGVRLLNLAMQWALGQSTETADNAGILLEKAVRLRSHDFRVWLALANQRILKFQNKPDSPAASVWLNEARSAALKALKLYPESISVRCALAHLADLSGDMVAAEAELTTVLNLLEDPNLSFDQLNGPLTDRKFDEFNTKWEMLNITLPKSDPDFIPRARSLFRWRILGKLYEITWKQNRFLKAYSLTKLAVELEPTSGNSHYALARVLRALGLGEESVASYREALKWAPLHPEIWIEYINLLFTLDRYEECLAAWNDLVAIINGCPPLEPLKKLLADTIGGCWERISSDVAARKQKLSASGRHRFIAMPNLSSPESWQPLVVSFLGRFKQSDPVDLLLRFEDSVKIADKVILDKIGRFIREYLRQDTDHIPNIVVLAEEISPEDYWKLIRVADTFVGDHPTVGRDIAQATGVPIVTTDELSRYQIPSPSPKAA